MGYSGTQCSIYVNGEYNPLPRDYTQSTQVNSSGNAVFYLTDNGQASGNAVYSKVFLSTAEASVRDASGIYGYGAPTISSDNKTLTIPVTKQTPSIVQVLGLNVLGGMTMNQAPVGTPVDLMVEGVSNS